MAEPEPKDSTGGPYIEGASYLDKGEDDQALSSIPIPRYLLAELPQFGEELPQYVEGVIETGKRRGDLEKVWLRVISKESKELLAAGDDRTWSEIADVITRVEPLESLFAGEPPEYLKDPIEKFDRELADVSSCIFAAKFGGGGQEDVDKLYKSLTVIVPALKVVSGRCEQRAHQILTSFDRCTVKIQDWVDRARAALDAASLEQRQAEVEKMVSESAQYAEGASTIMGERRESDTRDDRSSAGAATAKFGESNG